MSKVKKSGKRQTPKNLGDVTINDYANATNGKGRQKKSTNNVVQVLKQFEDNKSWEDKGELDLVENENEDGTVNDVARKVEPRRRKKTSSNSEPVEDRPGNVYPLDVWFLISEYIRPEDVGRFAAICKGCYTVVCSAKFWFRMYRKQMESYKMKHRSLEGLPEKFRPEAMFRLYGLRTSVIRALYYLYPPFKSRLTVINPFENHPDLLKGRRCVLMWYRSSGSHWTYYFKLREKVEKPLSRSHSNPDRKRQLSELLDDVGANIDEHCKILQITCSNFVLAPLVIGQTLNHASLALAQDLMHSRVHLWFGPGFARGQPASGSCPVVFDGVHGLKVLDWWHPSFPHDRRVHLSDDE